MSQSRFEIKVGLFVLICLGFLALLLVKFSKGTTFFRPTTTIILKAGNVGGLRARASVLMSGVQVGTVDQTLLSPEGTNVTIFLKIFRQYTIRSDARFVIEQSGFLGDQFVAVYPGDNKGVPLEPPNNVAHAEDPFNLLEVARSAAGFIKRIDETAKKLNDAINDVRRLVLNETTLTNLSFTISTFQQVSEDALATVDNVNRLIKTNGESASRAVSNLVVFSEQLNGFAQTAQAVLTNNSPQITTAINNLTTATAGLTNLIQEAQTGPGLVGTLLNDGQLSAHVSALSSNLMVTSSNLNRLGLWHLLWRQKEPKASSPTPPSASSKSNH